MKTERTVVCKQCAETKVFPVWLKGCRCHDCTKVNKKVWYQDNRDHVLDYVKRYRLANPEKMKAAHQRYRPVIRDRILRQKYGISQADFERMFEDQGRACAICKSPTANAGRYGWHTDHCHQTKKVRGILCHGCNVGIGNLRHSPDALRAAADYLERS